MNKNEYLVKLDNALKSAGVQDRSDIIEEYTEHFDLKIADGYSEEEISARLAAPDELAQQFCDIGVNSSELSKSGGIASKIATHVGVIFLDIIVAPIYLMLLTFVLTLAVASLAFFITGIFTALGIQSISGSGIALIPYMPLICRLLISIAILALGVLSAAGTEYCRMYVMQIGRKYLRWHKNLFSKKVSVSPPLPLNPWISPKKRRIMRSMVLISLIVFAVSFILGLVSMMISARSVEPWHVWGWCV